MALRTVEPPERRDLSAYQFRTPRGRGAPRAWPPGAHALPTRTDPHLVLFPSPVSQVFRRRAGHGRRRREAARLGPRTCTDAHRHRIGTGRASTSDRHRTDPALAEIASVRPAPRHKRSSGRIGSTSYRIWPTCCSVLLPHLRSVFGSGEKEGCIYTRRGGDRAVRHLPW